MGEVAFIVFSASEVLLFRERDRMLRGSRKDRRTSGDNVVVRIPDVDRGRRDHRTVMAVVLSSDRLGTAHGVLKQLFVRSMFEVCSSNGFLDSGNVPRKTGRFP
ncbi:MAG: hypothetical protein GY696_40610 [Gammaproteobacteria bacterium]|nr:hypothetical protein [Gammaproteobacteria bacterium]